MYGVMILMSWEKEPELFRGFRHYLDLGVGFLSSKLSAHLA